MELRTQLHWTVRSWSRLGLGIANRATSPHRVRWGLVTAAGLAYDQWLRQWLLRDPTPQRATRAVLDAVDAAVWTAVEHGAPRCQQSALVMIVQPTAVEHTFRALAGTESVPVPVGTAPFPRDGRGWVRAVAEVAGPAGGALVASRVVRRRHGRRWEAFEWRHVALGVTAGALLARTRAKGQTEARREWAARTASQIQVERRSAAVREAVRSSPGHDFKKVLTALAVSGSEPARRASHEQLARPEQVVGGDAGTTLWRAAWGLPIEPDTARDLWIDRDQARRLEAFLDAADDRTSATPALEPLRVEPAPDGEVRVSYRDASLALRNPTPHLEAALDPMFVQLGAAAAWKLERVVAPGRAPRHRWAVAAASVDLLLALGYRSGRRPDDRRRVHRHLLLSAGATLAYYVAAVVDPRPRAAAEASDPIVATGPAVGLASMVAINADRIDPRIGALAVVAAAGGWLAAARGASGAPRWAVARDGLLIVQAFHSSFHARRAVVAEAAHLERELQAQFASQVREARRAAAQEELDRFRGQVELAATELDRLGDEVDPSLARFIHQECEEVTTWIEQQEIALAAGS